MSVLELRLPKGIHSRTARTATGLEVHYLEAGPPDAPLLLLLHGFPELAFSWRHVIPRLAKAGYRVIAPDQRGYGMTTGSALGYDVDTAAFGMPQLVRDMLALLAALGIHRVAAVIGHDFGAPVACYAALMRPDVFGAVAALSAPFAGPPGWQAESVDIEADLAALTPPRKHYQWYYSERQANAEMRHAPQGLAAFLRAYFHCKSGDWPGNHPTPLGSWTATALATLPRYYVMDITRTMAEEVAEMAPEEGAPPSRWLPDADLAIYTENYARTGFQGGLNWYRRALSPEGRAALRLYAGARIGVPATFIAGACDWGVHQVPGALEAMERQACTDYRGTTLISGAGHWVQQEAPEETAAALLTFLHGVETTPPPAL